MSSIIPSAPPEHHYRYDRNPELAPLIVDGADRIRKIEYIIILYAIVGGMFASMLTMNAIVTMAKYNDNNGLDRYNCSQIEKCQNNTCTVVCEYDSIEYIKINNVIVLFAAMIIFISCVICSFGNICRDHNSIMNFIFIISQVGLALISMLLYIVNKNDVVNYSTLLANVCISLSLWRISKPWFGSN
jgi:hypothetical protein